jgi:hypothetical protein
MFIRKQTEDPMPADVFIYMAKRNPYYTRDQVARMFALVADQ